MGKGVRGRTVEGHFRADTDTGDHEADLVDDRIGQDAPHVVFEDRVNDPVEYHVKAKIDQDLSTRETAYEDIDGGFCGESRQEHRPRPGGLRIGIRQPGRKRWRPGIDQKTGQNEPAGDRIRLHGVELQ